MSEIDDPEKIKNREIKDRIGRKQELADIMWVLSTEQGRRFYWRTLAACRIFHTSFTGNNSTFFNEGMRQVGLYMLADMNEADPTAYLKCVQESKVQNGGQNG